MSVPKSTVLISLAASCAGLIAEPGSAQDLSLSYATNNSPTLTAKLKGEEAVADRIVQRAYIDFGASQYAFVVPPGYRMDATESGRVVLSTADYSSFITFRVIEATAEGSLQLNSDAYREMLLGRYPGARILEEFSQSAASRSGPAFDFQFTNRSGTVQSGRLAFIPARGAVLEFGVITPADNFTTGQYWLRSVMSTFRSNDRGKLVISPMSDRF